MKYALLILPLLFGCESGPRPATSEYTPSSSWGKFTESREDPAETTIRYFDTDISGIQSITITPRGPEIAK